MGPKKQIVSKEARNKNYNRQNTPLFSQSQIKTAENEVNSQLITDFENIYEV